MNEILERYLDKILEFEEQGYLEEALKLSEKLQETFSEDAEVLELILLERGKLEFRARADRKALLDFIHAYKVAKNEEIYQLIMEAYFVPNQEYFRTNYQNNMKFLEEYPHYRIRQGIKETKVVPLWQDDEWLVYVNTETKEFRILVRVKHELMPKPNDAVLIINEMWMDEIIACEEACKQSWSFMDADIPFVMTYDENDWILFCQLYELSELLKKRRCVFLVDEWGCRKWFDEAQTRMPQWIWYNGYQEKYEGILEEIEKKRSSDYKQNIAEVQRYYSGAKEEIQKRILETKPRILFFTSRFTTVLQYHTRDCMQAAKHLGCETELLIEKDGIHEISGLDVQKVIADFKPDIIFCIDHFRYEEDDTIPQEIVWITWIQDKLPQSTGNPKIQGMLKKRDIVISPFVSDLPGKHWNMNYKDVLKAPLSANQDIYKKRELLQEEKELYSCDICYVANASNYRKRVEEYKQEIPPEIHEDFQLVMDVYFQLMKEEIFYYGYERNKEVLSLILDQLKINWPEQFISQLAEDMVLSIGYSRYKSLIVEWLLEAGYTNIKLYGKEWGEDEKFRPYAMGVIENGEKLSKALNASKVVLAMHPVFSLAARTIEAVSSGAFCLVNDIPEADMANAREYFEEGKELIYFYGKQDLLEKLGYYLEHKEERERVVEAGLKKVSEVLTYERMMERVIRETSELLEKRSKEELI